MTNLKITKNMSMTEQKRRNTVNMAMVVMKERNMLNENILRNYLLNQTDISTYGGFLMTYEQALGYYNEITY